MSDELGALRNGVGALHNLGAALRSVGVPPRQLPPAIAAVAQACGPLRAANRRLCQSLDQAGLAVSGPTQLGPSVDDALQQLELALRAATRLRAGPRLRLEREVAGLADSLAAALPLFELMLGAAAFPGSSATAGALYHQLSAESEMGSAPWLGALDHPTQPERELGVSLELAARVSLAVGAELATRSRTALRVTLQVASELPQSVTLLEVAPRALLDPKSPVLSLPATVGVLNSVAVRIGARLECHQQPALRRIHWPSVGRALVDQADRGG